MELSPTWVAIGFTALNVGVMLFDRVKGTGAKWQELQSRQESHEKVCELRQTHIAEALERLEGATATQAKSAETFRHSLARKLTGMEIAVRVICHRIGVEVPKVHSSEER